MAHPNTQSATISAGWSTMMLYTVLCLYILQLSPVTSCKSEIRQAPDKVLNVRPRSPVHFTCTMDRTCDVSLISVEAYNERLMIRNLPDHVISQNQDLDFQGNFTHFQITLKVNSSTHYYCMARVLINGVQTNVKANGTLVVVDKGAGLTVNTSLLVLALLSLVFIRVGI